MGPLSATCQSVNTRKCASWPYYEYYLGEKDQQKRRNGDGRNYWTGAESIEWYTGHFIRDTMHGPGDYRWRYRGARGVSVTYEGNFYVNRLHGYGVMSYPDGKVFTGIFNNNVRYGPGVESFADRSQNVGLWRGTKLIRLAWRPPAPSLAPELTATPVARAFVEPHRVILNTTFKILGKINTSVELLKESGCDPVVAAENWTKLYPKFCTDTASQLCQVDLFKNDYYHGKIYSLQQQDADHENNEDMEKESQDSFEEVGPYFAWNNDGVIIDMMKHCFKHEGQRSQTYIDVMSVLTGPRRHFQRAAMHELDSRTLLMASYLGHTASTTFLVNERGVDPNIADMQGNSAVIYATCGDKADIINFLVEAGAAVDSCNDSCCSALGIALMRLTCAQRDISLGGIVQAMLPPPVIPPIPIIQTALEWNMTRELPAPPPPPPPPPLVKSPSKIIKVTVDRSTTKKEKSLISMKEFPAGKKKIETPKPDEQGYESDESVSEEKKLYKDINYEYLITVNDLFLLPGGLPAYLFDVYDMVKDIDDDKIIPEKNAKKQMSRVLKETTKASKEAMWQNLERDDHASMTSAEKTKVEMLERIKSTILQLLENGANPKSVRCPQTALFMAIVSNCPDLMRHLIHHGADANEVYPQLFNYTILDIAISRPMSIDSLEIIRALLEGGALTDHRLYYQPQPHAEPEKDIPGPTLLHAVLVRKAEGEFDEDIRSQILELLLEYNCDPLVQFKGRSAFEIATKNMDLLDIFVRSPKTDLNAIINDANQTILVKMFSMPYFKTIDSNSRLQMLTNLLLFGADPLIKCQNGEVYYENIFVMAQKTLSDLECVQPKQVTAVVKNDKAKKEPKKEEKLKPAGPAKSSAKMTFDDIGNLKQAIDLIKDCARLIHIRWLQAKLTNELIEVIDKYKHRHWNVILKEYKNNKVAGLWLTAQRCLEIWDLLKTTKKRIYNNKRTLKHLLCIVHFFVLRTKTSYGLGPVISVERDVIECDINRVLRERDHVRFFDTEMLPLQRLYMQPELFVRAVS